MTMPDGPVSLPNGAVLYPPEEPLVPTDMTVTEVTPVEYAVPRYAPKAAFTLLVGPTGSAKSIVSQAFASEGSRQGMTVAYFDGELPEAIAKARMARLGADYSFLRYFHRPQLDLQNPVDQHRMLYACTGADLIFVDTLSSFFFAEEGDNPAFVRVYRNLLAPLTELGAAVVVLDHSGVPSSGNPRTGVHKVRGQSSKAQKADLVVVAEPNGPKGFSLELVKTSRYGMDDEEPRSFFRVVDLADGGLDVVPEAQVAGQSRVAVETADRMVELVNAAGAEGITATELQTALGSGRRTYRAASALLELEEPARIRQVRTSRRSPSNGREYHAWRWFPVALAPVAVEEVAS